MRVITVERNAEVLTLAIDHPPVNALSTPVRQSLFDAVREAEGDPSIRAVVIEGNERLFSGGADLGEFAAGTAMDWPSLHGDILPLLAALSKPVVAAVRGSALGGGFELALGCHARVFAEGTRVGLPETTLGLMPGAGGTQSLPRAIGIERAAMAIVDGLVVPIETYADTPLVDAIVPLDRLRDAARILALDRAGGGPPFGSWSAAPIADPGADAQLARLRARVRARGHVLPGVERALDAIALTTSHAVDVGMPLEHALFAPLLDSRESRALRSVFLAERSLLRKPGYARLEATLSARLRGRLQEAWVRMRSDATTDRTIAVAAAAHHWPALVDLLDLRDLRAADDVAIPQALSDRAFERLELAVLAEGLRLLDEGIAEHAAEVDLVLIRACGYPRHTGGPLHQARTRDRTTLAQLLSTHEAVSGSAEGSPTTWSSRLARYVGDAPVHGAAGNAAEAQP